MRDHPDINLYLGRDFLLKKLFVFASNLDSIIGLLSKKIGLNVQHLSTERESEAYAAASFSVNGHKIIYRHAKITPTKTGQFVTVWKRNNAGITQPFDVKDDVDFIIIAAQTETNSGIFIFPKEVLMKQAIISNNDDGGKRGIRVYPPWDIAESKQAIKTQQWQTNYFYNFNDAVKDAAIAKIFA